METTNLSKIRREKMLNTISEIKKNITDEKMLTNQIGRASCRERV